MRVSAWGIERTYVDFRGDRKTVPPESVALIGRSMGADRSSKPPPAPVRFARGGGTIALRRSQRLVLEDGSHVSPAEARTFELPLGYHSIEADDEPPVRVIVSPGMCFVPLSLRIWGWAVQLYAARSRGSWGMGDLRDLRSLGEWARGMGAGALLVNPLGAVMPGAGQQASPYYPSSRCRLNPLYIRVQDVPGAHALPDLQDLVRAGGRLNDDRRIDRDRVYALKIQALERLWARFRDAHGAFDDFVAREGEALRDFATYTTAAEVHGRDQTKWPPGLRSPSGAGTARFRRDRRERIRFHMWLQWIADAQLAAAARRCPLIADLPVGVDPAGADRWMWSGAFAEGVTVGAPPDEFNTRGQDWGLPPFDPWKLRTAGYEPIIQTLRAGMRHAAGLRIDHVMGLFRLYWVPHGEDPSRGAYVRYRHDDLLDIVALESARAGAYVIGEDLGTVEPLVREQMAARNLLSYRLMLFENDPPRAYPELACAAITSHDLPTIAGLWTGADLDEQRDLGLDPNPEAMSESRRKLKKQARVRDDASVGDVIERVHRSLARAPSEILLATLDDAAASIERPNHPGIAGEGRNWSLALPLSLERLKRRDLPRRIAAALARRGHRA